MRICFVVNALRTQRPTYTTMHLAYEAMRRGHDVHMASIDAFAYEDEGRVVAHAVAPPPRASMTLREFWKFLTAEDREPQEICLTEFDVVFLRNNPATPSGGEGRDRFNPAIEFGRHLKGSGVRVLNDPDGLLRAGSKLYLAGIPEQIRPRTFVSRNGTKIKAFLKRLDGPAILKPLSGFGGKNVFYVRRGQIRNLNPMIDTVRKAGYVIAQEYLPEASRGDKRVLLLAGEPIRVGGIVATYTRMRPKDDIRNNIHAGGHRKRCGLSAFEAHVCSLLKPCLLADGLYFVGVDLVGDKVLEINVFAPGGIHNMKELYGVNVSEVVIADLEERVRGRTESGPMLVANEEAKH